MSRDELLDTALKTLNTRPTASMAQIAEAAGISRATLHRHFENRDALLHELGQRSLDLWENALDAAAVDQVRSTDDPAEVEATLRTLLRSYVGAAESLGFTLTDVDMEQLPALAERTSALIQREAAFLSAAQRAGVLRQDVPPAWLGWSIFGLLVAAREALRFGDVGSRAVVDLFMSTYLEGNGAR